jgi:hypothetical protein
MADLARISELNTRLEETNAFLRDLEALDKPQPNPDEEICGETYDHDIPSRDYEDSPEGPWTCRRCGAEIWPESEED